MIYKGSRYAKTEVIAPENNEGKTPRVLEIREIPETAGVFEHIVSAGERLDLLAHRFYGDPKKSWLILDANTDELNPFHLLKPGRRIRVPQNRIV
ncbi:MAG: hypothetical protein HY282_09430 [Nitrospirae bacterium]|nr:hypothetical protein [Candidatus Manganitrophaceae bacterium]